jgi:sigma-B regulation protein RsbU (phosphoserine phosphatase)
MRILSVFLMSFFILNNTGYTSEPVKNILVLNSYHEGFSWTDGINSSIKNYFSGSKNKVELYFEYLDGKRFSDNAYLKQLTELYLFKFRDREIDVIIAADDNALDLLLENEKKLFTDVPVVYTGINNLTIPDVVNGKRYTGILEETPPDGAVHLALKLHPGVKKIYVLADYSSTGRARIQSLEMIRYDFSGIAFEYSANTTIDEIKKRLSTLDEKSLVLLLAYFNDSTGTFFSYEELMSAIYPVTSVPIYAVSNNFLGQGITGGVVNSSEVQGREASRVAERILNGEKPENIPPKRDVELKTVLDYKELKKFGVNTSLVPANSLIINSPKGFYDFYKENMVFFLVVVSAGFFAGIIALASGRNKILRINRERLKVISELSSALNEVTALRGLLPICANCKKIRNDQGYWERIENYVTDHSGLVFTHSLCPDCAKKLYPEFSDQKEEK